MPKAVCLGRFRNFSELQSAIVNSRSRADKEARTSCGKGFVRSRGTWFNTLSDKKGLIAPREENWAVDKITAKVLTGLIAEVLANHPEVDSITVSGGFDFAENLQAFNSGDYDPWVSEWLITVWTRSGVYPAPEESDVTA